MAQINLAIGRQTWVERPTILGISVERLIAGGSAFDRGHFMAVLGLVNSAAFLLVIVAGAVPRWMISPCR